jgi:hypothetical protein
MRAGLVAGVYICEPDREGTMKLALLVGVAALAAGGGAAHAAIWSDSNFSTPVAQPSFVVGTDAVGVYYTNTVGGSPGYVDGLSGNPAPDLRVAQYGSSLALALAAPTAAETWTFAFDYARGNTWGAPTFQVFALASDGSVDLNSALYGGDATLTNGSMLLSTTLPAGQTAWTAQSFEVPIPAGYGAVMFRIARDGSESNSEIDNLMITGSAVPEPASLGLLALGAVGLLRRR